MVNKIFTKYFLIALAALVSLAALLCLRERTVKIGKYEVYLEPDTREHINYSLIVTNDSEREVLRSYVPNWLGLEDLKLVAKDNVLDIKNENNLTLLHVTLGDVVSLESKYYSLSPNKEYLVKLSSSESDKVAISLGEYTGVYFDKMDGIDMQLDLEYAEIEKSTVRYVWGENGSFSLHVDEKVYDIKK
jgi:hypothetical protein